MMSSTNFGLSNACSVTNFSSGRFSTAYTGALAAPSMIFTKSSIHSIFFVRTRAVISQRWLCAPYDEISFEHGHKARRRRFNAHDEIIRSVARPLKCA